MCVCTYTHTSLYMFTHTHTHKVYPESIQPCTMKNRDIYWGRYKKHCTQDNDASVPFKVAPWDLTPLLPAISCLIVFSWISLMVWNLFLFKGDCSFGKKQKSQGANPGLSGGWVTWVTWCFTETLHEMWCMTKCVVMIKLPSPVAHSCGLLNHPNSFHRECSSLTQKLIQISGSIRSVILNVTATQYTCSHNSIYCPHWLVQ